MVCSVQRYRDRSADASSSEVRHHVSDAVMAERLREADLVCQLTDTRQSLLLAEQQVSSSTGILLLASQLWSDRVKHRHSQVIYAVNSLRCNKSLL
jgi:cobalamin biosynthesis Mg chelatase CobN